MKHIFVILYLLLSFFIVSHAFAAEDVSCSAIYGGGKLCTSHPDLSINMQIAEPDSSVFREALTAQSNYYKPGEIVTFKITITNVSNKNLTDIDVVYTFPPYTSGGNTTNVFSRKIASLEKGDTTSFNTQARIAKDNLPLTSPLCLVNYVEMRQGGKVGSDATQFCVNNAQAVASAQTKNPEANKGLPVYDKVKAVKTPATGPEAFVFLGGILSIIGGLLLRKRFSLVRVASR